MCFNLLIQYHFAPFHFRLPIVTGFDVCIWKQIIINENAHPRIVSELCVIVYALCVCVFIEPILCTIRWFWSAIYVIPSINRLINDAQSICFPQICCLFWIQCDQSTQCTNKTVFVYAAAEEKKETNDRPKKPHRSGNGVVITGNSHNLW